MNFVSDLLDVSDDGVYQDGRWGDIVVDVSEYCTLCLWPYLRLQAREVHESGRVPCSAGRLLCPVDEG